MSYKAKGLLCYLLGWIPCVIILFGVNDNTRDEYFNVAQALVLHLLYIIVCIFLIPLSIIVALSNPLIGFPLSKCVHILYVVLIVIGCVKTCNEGDSKIPILGDLTEKIFKSKLDSFSSTSNSSTSTYNYDPNTGEKINNTNNKQNWKYDPNTGKKIEK